MFTHSAFLTVARSSTASMPEGIKQKVCEGEHQGAVIRLQ